MAIDIPTYAGQTSDALRDLQTAFQRGLVTTEQVQELFTKGKSRHLQNQLLDDEIEIAPARKEATKARLAEEIAISPLRRDALIERLRSDIQILPKATQADLLRFDSNIKLAPKQTELQRGQLDAAIQILPKQTELQSGQLDSAIEILPLQKDADLAKLHKGFDDPAGVNEAAVRRYFEITGKQPPVTAEGSFDFEAIEAEIAPLIEASRRFTASKELTPAQKEFVEFFRSQNHPELAFNADGSLKSIVELSVAAEELRRNPPQKPLTPQQQLEEAKSLDATEALLIRLKDAAKVVKNRKVNVVGPVIGSPLNPVPFIESIKGDPQRRNSRRELEMLANELTAEKTQLLRGSLSEKELKFIQASVPKLTDDEAVWSKWISERIPLLEKALKAGRDAAGGKSPGQGTAAGPKQVSTLAEARKLPNGTQFVLPDGSGGVVP